MDDEPTTLASFSQLNDDDINFASLLRIGSEALESCEEKIQTWKKQQNEYTDLKASLENLPLEISHDVMVPFGNCAFMPGKMIHTNEFLVLLGDNWFVSRSAFQAIEIVLRRLEYVEKELKKLEEEKDFYMQKLKIVEQFGNNEEDIVEIREPLKDAAVDSDVIKTSAQLNNMATPTGVLPEDYAKLMDRLDELEKLEELEDARAMDEENGSEVSAGNMQINSEQNNDRTTDSVRSETVDSDDDQPTCSVSNEINETMKTILDKVVKSTSRKNNFDEFSERKFLKKVTWDESSLENLVDCCAGTPTDESIPTFVKMEEHDSVALPPMKSILKNRRESSPVDHNLIREMEERRASTVLPGSVEAFTGIVCEKTLSSVNKSATTTQETFKRPASKFRVQRASIQ